MYYCVRNGIDLYPSEIKQKDSNKNQSKTQIYGIGRMSVQAEERSKKKKGD